MNGTGPEIQIFKPFGEAFELMKKILFQPFDLKKWFMIGLAAWLANLGGGGGGFNYRYDRGEDFQKLNETISRIPHPVLITGICALIAVVLLLVVLFAWLRARSRFMFIDCIVKNRGAIAEPWREFRTEGNRYFLFSVTAAVCLVLFAALLSAPLVYVAIRGRFYLSLHRDRLEPYVLLITALWVFLIVVAMASVMVGCVVTCATCCIAAIPYVGTVILLPIFVLLRSFSLLFLRQFGPEYDVWASFTPPEHVWILSPHTAPPPSASLGLPPQPPSSPSV